MIDCISFELIEILKMNVIVNVVISDEPNSHPKAISLFMWEIIYWVFIICSNTILVMG